MARSFYLNLHDVAIHCISEGFEDNPPILFVHGSSTSCRFFESQMEDKVLDSKYALYAFDLPGHGESQKAIDSGGYSLKNLGQTLAEVVATLKLNNYIVVAVSIATNILAEASAYLQGCKGIFLVGACIIGDQYPLSSIVKDFPYMYLLTASSASIEELQGYAEFDMYQPSSETIQKFTTAYRETDPDYRREIGNVLLKADYNDEVSLIKKWDIPVALVYGKQEAIVNHQYLANAGLMLWENTIHLIEDAGHLANMDNPSQFNQLLLDFANDVL